MKFHWPTQFRAGFRPNFIFSENIEINEIIKSFEYSKKRERQKKEFELRQLRGEIKTGDEFWNEVEEDTPESRFESNDQGSTSQNDRSNQPGNDLDRTNSRNLRPNQNKVKSWTDLVVIGSLIIFV